MSKLPVDSKAPKNGESRNIKPTHVKGPDGKIVKVPQGPKVQRALLPIALVGLAGFAGCGILSTTEFSAPTAEMTRKTDQTPETKVSKTHTKVTIEPQNDPNSGVGGVTSVPSGVRKSPGTVDSGPKRQPD